MDWENVKYFLAAARGGTLVEAGRLLGVQHSTVLRRIANLEQELGLKLFERRNTGYVLTEAGKEMFESARQAEDELVTLERRLSGRDLRLTGAVRIAAPGMLIPWIALAVTEFRRMHPGIVIDAVISPMKANLARREAEIAIRVSRDPLGSLVGRRIATPAYGIYGALSHPAAKDPAPDWTAQDWISYTGNHIEIPQAQWVSENIPPERVVLRANHTGMVAAAAAAGAGLAVLPCYVGEREPNLRCLKKVGPLGHDMWILTHADLKRTPRIRALMEHLTRHLLRYRDLIEGKAPDREERQLSPAST